MLLCEMPKEKYKSMKAYYNEKALNKTNLWHSDLDALGRKAGQPIYQERKSSVMGGRKEVSAMDD